MKKLIPYLSVSVLILAMFSFMNLSYAQQTKTEEASTPAEVTKANTSHSINFDFGYDFLAKYKKSKLEDETFLSSDDTAGYMDLKLSFNFLTESCRFGFGLGIILPKDYDNELSGKWSKTRDTEYSGSSEINKYEQKLSLGLYAQLFQFGYRINLNYVELIPYIGINFLYMQEKNPYRWYETETGDLVVYKFMIPVYTGLNFIFAHAGPMNFYTGFEVGYAIKIKLKGTSDNNSGYHINSGASDLIAKESDPLIGLMGKITIGTAFKF